MRVDNPPTAVEKAVEATAISNTQEIRENIDEKSVDNDDIRNGVKNDSEEEQVYSIPRDLVSFLFFTLDLKFAVYNYSYFIRALQRYIAD